MLTDKDSALRKGLRKLITHIVVVAFEHIVGLK